MKFTGVRNEWKRAKEMVEGYTPIFSQSGTAMSGDICKVSPIAIMSILSHFERKDPKQDTIIGIVVGSAIDGNIVIETALPLVYETEEQEVDISYQFLRGQLRRVVGDNKKLLLGWYTNKLQGKEDITMSLNQLITYEMQGNPLIIEVNCACKDSDDLIRVFSSSKASFHKDKKNYIFHRIHHELKSNQEVALGLSLLLRQDQSSSQPLHQAASIQSVLQQYEYDIQVLKEYFTEHVEGKKDVDAGILEDALKLLATAPSLAPAHTSHAQGDVQLLRSLAQVVKSVAQVYVEGAANKS